MRALDAVSIGIALVLVPLVSWYLGRLLGRRDWSIVPVLLASLLATLLVQGAVAFYSPTVVVNADGTWNGLELAGFLIVFGAFVAMIGWSSVPAQKSSQTA
jgi:hypothetical protein